MILIGLGANMPHPEYGEPVRTLAAAVRAIDGYFTVVRQSSWYRSAPVPASDQPWFANAVIEIETDLKLPDVLAVLHKIEKKFGRVRRQKWEARVLDLDILVFHDMVSDNQDQSAGPVVPHPFLHERAFVLAPMAEIAPLWRHPVNGLSAAELLAKLPQHQQFDVIDQDRG